MYIVALLRIALLGPQSRFGNKLRTLEEYEWFVNTPNGTDRAVGSVRVKVRTRTASRRHELRTV